MTGRRFATGLVLGKFLPVHAGHLHLIDSAAAACDELTVAVQARSDEPIDLATRLGWMAELRPEVRVVGVVADHRIDLDDDATWRWWVACTLEQYRADGRPGAPDAVFTSEAYGDELGRRLGAVHVAVDPGRTAVPVSGTAVRADPRAAWAHLPGPVRGHLARRAVLVGAESTGKTTLAARLAQRYATTWVPEHGRVHTERKWAAEGPDAPWRTDEFVDIARRQRADEEAGARAAEGGLVVCDTDALATAVWHERYVGDRSPQVEAIAAERLGDLYLLCRDDVDWVDDGLRDGEHLRAWMTARFVEVLAAVGVRWIELAGSWPERERTAVAAIDALLAEPRPLVTPDYTRHGPTFDG